MKKGLAVLRAWSLCLDYKVLVLVGAFLVLGLALFPSYRYQVNPDGTSYIRIAEEYAHGHLKSAINGYWGPFLSWLIIPSFYLHIQPIAYIKLLQIAINALTVYVVYRLIRGWGVGLWFCFAGAIVTGLIGLDLALAGPLTPDLLVCLLTLLLWGALSDVELSHANRRTLLSIATLGALLYFSKVIGLYLFLGSLVIWTGYSFLNHKTPTYRKDLLKAAVTAATCIALILPFVLAISIKYHIPMFGSSAKYNIALAGPHNVGHPMMYSILPPPNKYAISAWEDPTYISVVEWHPFRSKQDIQHLIENITINFTTLQTIISGGLLLATVPALIYYLSTKYRLAGYLAIGLIVINIGLYLPMFIEWRYITSIGMIIGLGYCAFLNNLWRAGKRLATAGSILIGLSLIIVPINDLNIHRNIDRDIAMSGYALRKYLAPNSRIASDEFGTVYASLYTSSQFYGVIDPTAPNLLQTLHTYGITYLLIGPVAAQQLINRGITMTVVHDHAYLDKTLYLVP